MDMRIAAINAPQTMSIIMSLTMSLAFTLTWVARSCPDYTTRLADEQITRSMQHEHCLLIGRLHAHKPHGGALDCFADRFSVGRIMLTFLHKGNLSRLQIQR